jgi:hypothetical protein
MNSGLSAIRRRLDALDGGPDDVSHLTDAELDAEIAELAAKIAAAEAAMSPEELAAHKADPEVAALDAEIAALKAETDEATKGDES